MCWMGVLILWFMYKTQLWPTLVNIALQVILADRLVSSAVHEVVGKILSYPYIISPTGP